MKIKEIVSQSRRDFIAIYECDHCGATERGRGYDDAYFHQDVIPNMACKQCGMQAKPNYRPLTTKYAEGEVV